tara:strand:+ start:236 stop:409 length:174 start_codon:yes stop_codon:yes gene_type:complete
MNIETKKAAINLFKKDFIKYLDNDPLISKSQLNRIDIMTQRRKSLMLLVGSSDRNDL